MKHLHCTIACLILLSLTACSDDDGLVAEEGRLTGMTDAHNVVRADAAAMPDLQWDAKIAGVAQAYAEELAADGCELRHSSGPYGENIFWGSGLEVSPERVVASWASEKSDYSYPTNGCSDVCGHYTQIVWAQSLRLGCGFSICDNDSEIWVCNYDPPGNYVGEKPY